MEQRGSLDRGAKRREAKRNCLGLAVVVVVVVGGDGAGGGGAGGGGCCGVAKRGGLFAIAPYEQLVSDFVPAWGPCSWFVLFVLEGAPSH